MKNVLFIFFLFAFGILKSQVPVASFTSPTLKCTGSPVLFTDQSTNSPTSWAWTFSGGTPATSTQQNPSVTFNAAGSITVTLIATNGSGSSTSYSQAMVVSNSPALTIAALGLSSNNSMCAGNSSTVIASGATTYTWNTGATAYSIVVSPVTSTSYTVTGTSAAGCTATATRSIGIDQSVPSLTVTASSSSVCAGSTATLFASGASSYLWNPGGATTASYVVSPFVTTNYTVTGANGCGTSNAVSPIAVYASPNLAISGPGSVCKGATANYTVTGAAVTFTWSTGSLSSTLAITPTINTTFSVTGTGANGCSNMVQKTVIVTTSKNISGAVTSTAGTVTGAVVLYKYVLGAIWDSITTSQITSANYQFNFIDSGQYVVKAFVLPSNMLDTYGAGSANWQGATVINHGCTSNATQDIQVAGLAPLGSGPGSLSGRITEGPGYGGRAMSPGTPIGGISVKGGKNPGGAAVNRTITDSDGKYILSGMPNNQANESYFIIVDLPGLDTTNTYHRIIIDGSQNYDNLDFTVDSAGIKPDLTVGVKKEMTIAAGKINLYPNPADSKFTLQFTLSHPAELTIEMMDIYGRNVKTITPKTLTNEKDIQVVSGLNNIKPGVYFIRIRIDKELVTTKLIVTD